MAWMGLSVTHLYQARQFGITHWVRTPIFVQKGSEILNKFKISHMLGIQCLDIINEH